MMSLRYENRLSLIEAAQTAVTDFEQQVALNLSKRTIIYYCGSGITLERVDLLSTFSNQPT